MGVAVELMRQDRGLIAAQRLMVAAMQPSTVERSEPRYDELENVYAFESMDGRRHPL
jgi:hypothetical protein